MVKYFLQASIFFAIAGILQVQALYCFQCLHCEQAEKVECNKEAVRNLTTGLERYFYNIPDDVSEKYDCITVAYMTDDHHAKIRGCIYDNTYACSIKPKNYSISYICGTCDTDFCNSPSSHFQPSIAFTLLGTAAVAVVARIF